MPRTNEAIPLTNVSHDEEMQEQDWVRELQAGLDNVISPVHAGYAPPPAHVLPIESAPPLPPPGQPPIPQVQSAPQAYGPVPVPPAAPAGESPEKQRLRETVARLEETLHGAETILISTATAADARVNQSQQQAV